MSFYFYDILFPKRNLYEKRSTLHAIAAIKYSTNCFLLY